MLTTPPGQNPGLSAGCRGADKTELPQYPAAGEIEFIPPHNFRNTSACCAWALTIIISCTPPLMQTALNRGG